MPPAPREYEPLDASGADESRDPGGTRRSRRGRSLPQVKGRGASRNPTNRFEPLDVERDRWTDDGGRGPETRFYRDSSRSIITTNSSPDVGFEASVNPYRGCEHGCVYCLHGSTPVLMGDGRYAPIEKLRPGDVVYGTARHGFYRRYVRTPVLDHWATRRRAYRIELADATSLVASGDHRFLTLRGWKHVTGSDQGADRRPHLTLNDSVLGVGATEAGAETGIEPSPDYRRGYLCGMIRGDGLLGRWEYDRPGRANGTQYQFRLALADGEALDRTARFLRTFRVGTHRVPFSSARGCRTMSAIRTHARGSVERIERLVAWPGAPSRDWERGFLSGIFDAEGSYSGGTLRIANSDPVIVRRVLRSSRRFSFDTVEDRRPPGRDGRPPVRYLRIRGGLREHLRFFHCVDPAIRRKCDLEDQALKSGADLRVRSVEPLGREVPMFDITTGTGDFIAAGVVSHNCYARPGHEYLGLSSGLDFESRIFVKENAPQLLRDELSSASWEPKVLAMSGVTDPYQPVERELEITRRCLRVLADFRNPVSMITKSHTVTRDVDLLEELAGHDAARVSLSVTTLDSDLRRAMEPRTSPAGRRVKAIRELSDAGIPVAVMVAPVIPGLTDRELPEILEAAAEAGARRASYILLRLPHAVKDLFGEWLERNFPDRKGKVLNRIREMRGGRLNDPRFGSRMRGEGPYARQLRDMFRVTCRRLGLNEEERPLSTSAFRRQGETSQMELFAE